jgi:regulator of replication initiation timing
MKTPTNIRELVAQMVELESQVQRLQRENKALKNINENGRQLAGHLISKTTQKSTFSNYEVKQHAKDISEALSKRPALR